MKVNRSTSNGSIIFLLLFVVSAMAIIMYSSLRMINYTILLIHEREKYEIHYELVQGLNKLCLAKYKYLMNTGVHCGHNYTLFKGPWPVLSGDYEGCCWVTIRNNSMTILNNSLSYKRHIVMTDKSIVEK